MSSQGTSSQGTQAGEGLEKQLLHLLQFSGIDAENLRELVSIVVGLQSKGLKAFRIFPRGIAPVVDGVSLQATVSANDVANILNVVLKQTPRLGGVSIFPYGITNPEFFQVNIALGNTVEAGNAVAVGGGD